MLQITYREDNARQADPSRVLSDATLMTSVSGDETTGLGAEFIQFQYQDLNM